MNSWRETRCNLHHIIFVVLLAQCSRSTPFCCISLYSPQWHRQRNVRGKFKSSTSKSSKIPILVGISSFKLIECHLNWNKIMFSLISIQFQSNWVKEEELRGECTGAWKWLFRLRSRMHRMPWHHCIWQLSDGPVWNVKQRLWQPK